MSEELLLEATGLSPLAGGPTLDLALRRGLIVLLGPERERLSAWLRTLAGVEPAATGELRLLGRPLVGPRSRDWQLLRRRVGLVTPEAPLLSIISGLRNVMLPGLYHRIGGEREVEARAQTLLGEIAYDADHGCLPAYMSDLQRHHLLIARALILEPRILLLDRPFELLDHEAHTLLRDYVTGPVRQRTGLVLVASNDGLLAQQADAVLFVGRAHVALYPDWATLLAAPQDEVRRHIAQQRQQCAAFE